jgi:1-hydroxy-2-methyl-2-(E)-butenyl 4-diphosphate synthase
MKKDHHLQHTTIGSITIGEGYPVAIQTMTNTITSDVTATVEQTKRVIQAGAEMVRITVPTLKEVEPFRKIIQVLRSEGITIPIIADVHYLPEVAEVVACFVDKVRINPGNFVDKREFKTVTLNDQEYQESLEKMAQRAKPLIEICKQHNTAIRVGVNQGSLCDRIVSRYGNTPKAMVVSALEWTDICNRFEFTNLVFSLKSSNVNTMIEATTLLYREMRERGFNYPIHLGVTEAADGREGRVKSAIGIGSLLLHQIGNTIRVSLTENPENEVIFAKKMMLCINQFDASRYTIENETLTISGVQTDEETWWAECGVVAGYFHYNRAFKEVVIQNPHFEKNNCTELADTILQGCRIKLSKTEIIACPSCGRTQFDIQKVLGLVKERFSSYPGLKIGVMGCVVNGPGEMADADIGIIGSSNGKMAVYKGTNRISPFVASEEAFSILENEIKKICSIK